MQTELGANLGFQVCKCSQAVSKNQQRMQIQGLRVENKPGPWHRSHRKSRRQAAFRCSGCLCLLSDRPRDRILCKIWAANRCWTVLGELTTIFFKRSTSGRSTSAVYFFAKTCSIPSRARDFAFVRLHPSAKVLGLSIFWVYPLDFLRGTGF